MFISIETFKKSLDNRESFSYSEMFKTAEKWSKERNDKNDSDIKWSWDCGLKLDYDGSLVTISSRFYPPHKSHADFGKYSGWVSIYFLDEKIGEKEFIESSLDSLALEVETFVSEIVQKIKETLSPLVADLFSF